MRKKTVFKGFFCCDSEKNGRFSLSLSPFFQQYCSFRTYQSHLHYTLDYTWPESISQKRQPMLPHNSSVGWAIWTPRQTQITVFNKLTCLMGWIQENWLLCMSCGLGPLSCAHKTDISSLAVGGLLNHSQTHFFIKRWINKEMEILLNAGQSLNQCNRVSWEEGLGWAGSSFECMREHSACNFWNGKWYLWLLQIT